MLRLKSYTTVMLNFYVILYNNKFFCVNSYKAYLNQNQINPESNIKGKMKIFWNPLNINCVISSGVINLEL